MNYTNPKISIKFNQIVIKSKLIERKLQYEYIRAVNEMVPKKFGPREIWAPRNLVPEKLGPLIKMLYNDFYARPKFLGSRGPNFLGTKKVRGHFSLRTVVSFAQLVETIFWAVWTEQHAFLTKIQNHINTFLWLVKILGW